MNVLEARHLSKRYGNSPHIALNDVSLTVGDGEVLAVVGESGSGKTTLLRLVAGLEIPTAGEVLLNGHVASSARGCVPPERRGVGIVFQDYALFPHLTVLENVAFGLQTLRRKQQRERALQALSLVGLLEYGGRYPHELSGGQQQRVALARAMAPQPALLLLDEPFSNLDVMLKEQVREEVGEILRRAGTTGIFVVHDLDDVLSVADRIAILRNGRLQQIDTPAEVYRKPADAYVAHLFGTTSLLPAVPADGGFQTPVGFVRSSAARDLTGPVVLSVRPEDLIVGSGNGGTPATVRQVRYRGSHNELVLDPSGAPELTLVARVAAHDSPATGDVVVVQVKAETVRVLG